MKTAAKNTHSWKRIAFLFQGGGALGAFQVGVYEALQEAGYDLDWVCGVSIGAINAAIIAGNKPEDRVAKLKKFWRIISTPAVFSGFGNPAIDTMLRRFYNYWYAQATLLFGQVGFFFPRVMSPHFMLNHIPTEISFYETSILRATLESLIDFDRLNNGETRITLSAVRVDNGEHVIFDSKTQRIGPEHVMASGALPPGFPAIEIDGKLYWDGGIVNNTPLEIVLNDMPRMSTLCFMVHLFATEGHVPNNLDQILLRHKDMTYSSNYKRVLEAFCKIHDMRKAIDQLYNMLPNELKESEKAIEISKHGCKTTMTLVRFHRHSLETDLSSKDYTFSEMAVQEGMDMGYEQAKLALKTSPWLKPIPDHIGAMLYDIDGMHDGI